MSSIQLVKFRIWKSGFFKLAYFQTKVFNQWLELPLDKSCYVCNYDCYKCKNIFQYMTSAIFCIKIWGEVTSPAGEGLMGDVQSKFQDTCTFQNMITAPKLTGQLNHWMQRTELQLVTNEEQFHMYTKKM